MEAEVKNKEHEIALQIGKRGGTSRTITNMMKICWYG